MKKLSLYGVFLIITVTGCTSMKAPSSSLFEEKPVIQIGTSGDVPKDHIVYIPATTPFPVDFSINGSVFHEGASSQVMVSFKEDLYLYKYWASQDGKKWVHSHKLMDVKPSGGFDKSGGKVTVSLDLK